MFTIKKEDGHEALSMPSTYKKSPREPKTLKPYEDSLVCLFQTLYAR